MRIIIAVVVFAISAFIGLVIVSNGVLAGRYETLFPYTEAKVCNQGEDLVLKKATSTTGGTVLIDGVAHDAGFTEKTLFCVDNASGGRREVTDQAYDEVEKLQTRVGWWVTFGLFAAIMLPILVFWRVILGRIDRVIGYQSPDS